MAGKEEEGEALGPKQGLGMVLTWARIGSSVFQSHAVLSLWGRS